LLLRQQQVLLAKAGFLQQGEPGYGQTKKPRIVK